MANESVTIDGLKEFKAGIDKLDKTVTEKLRAVSWRSSRNVKDGAQARLLARRNAPRTAASMTITEDASKHLFRVEVPGDPLRPEMLPVWLEHGTIYMGGANYLGNAVEAENRRYLKEMEQAAIDGAAEALD